MNENDIFKVRSVLLVNCDVRHAYAFLRCFMHLNNNEKTKKYSEQTIEQQIYD